MRSFNDNDLTMKSTKNWVNELKFVELALNGQKSLVNKALKGQWKLKEEVEVSLVSFRTVLWAWFLLEPMLIHLLSFESL